MTSLLYLLLLLLTRTRCYSNRILQCATITLENVCSDESSIELVVESHRIINVDYVVLQIRMHSKRCSYYVKINKCNVL